MEKGLLLFGLTSLLCALTAASATATGSTVFSDDFEDGDISDWTIVEMGPGYVAAEQDPGPDWSLNIHSPFGTSSRAQAVSPVFEMAESLDYDVSLEFGFETPIHWIEVFRNGHINTVIDNCPGAHCTFRCRYDGSNHIIDSLYAYTTYHIDYEVHPRSGTYDVYVGGIFKRTCDFDAGSVPFPQFRVGDIESGSTNYGVAMYDDFIITQTPAGVRHGENLPAAYGLGQNRPNPFRAATAIVLDLPEPGFVDLRVYDAGGRLVKTLLNQMHPAGSYSVTWTAEDETGNKVGPGIYFIRMEAGESSDIKKMILLR
jgi:hypothetical protein